MRGLIFAVVVLLASAAHADNAVPSIMAVTSTMTVATISITSATATSVIVSTSPLYRQVCVQNLDSGSFLACGETANVSTITANSLFGIYLATNTATLPSIPYCFEVVPGNNFYCRSAASGASRAVIIRKR